MEGNRNRVGDSRCRAGRRVQCPSELSFCVSWLLVWTPRAPASMSCNKAKVGWYVGVRKNRWENDYEGERTRDGNEDGNGKKKDKEESDLELLSSDSDTMTSQRRSVYVIFISDEC